MPDRVDLPGSGGDIGYQPLTGCFNSKAWLTYLKSHGFPLDGLLDGIEFDQEFLLDDTNWIPTEQAYRLAANITAKFPHDPLLFRQIAHWAIHQKINRSIIAIFMAFLSPYTVYKNMPQRMMFFNRHRKCELSAIGRGRAVLHMKHMTGVKAQRDICLWTRSLMEAAPLAVGYPLSTVKEVGCECDGESRCTLEISWHSFLPLLAKLRNIRHHKRNILIYQREALEENHRLLLRRCEELVEAKRQIEQYSQTLEIKVEERTEELSRNVVQLKDMLAKVKTLSGLLPICASCKKIRDDKGYWEQIEVYVKEHTQAEFSHGLCPACKAQFLSDFRRSLPETGVQPCPLERG